MKVGDIVYVKNENRKFGADPGYYVAWVKTNADTIYPIALTSEGFHTATVRAGNNMEDMPHPTPSYGVWHLVIAALGGVAGYISCNFLLKLL